MPITRSIKDDVTGQEIAESDLASVKVTWDGNECAMYLTAESAAAVAALLTANDVTGLRTLVMRSQPKHKRSGSGSAASASASGASGASRAANAEKREWIRANVRPISERGKFKASDNAAWDAHIAGSQPAAATDAPAKPDGDGKPASGKPANGKPAG